jgi:hypothetical protein
MEFSNKDIGKKSQASLTPSGFFGDSINNIVEIKDFLTLEERRRLMDFAPVSYTHLRAHETN